MARSSCENCGCAVYDGRCTNCHESLYIMDQYLDLSAEGFPLPADDSEFMQRVRQDEADVRRKKALKGNY